MFASTENHLITFLHSTRRINVNPVSRLWKHSTPFFYYPSFYPYYGHYTISFPLQKLLLNKNKSFLCLFQMGKSFLLKGIRWISLDKSEIFSFCQLLNFLFSLLKVPSMVFKLNKFPRIPKRYNLRKFLCFSISLLCQMSNLSSKCLYQMFHKWVYGMKFFPKTNFHLMSLFRQPWRDIWKRHAQVS